MSLEQPRINDMMQVAELPPKAKKPRRAKNGDASKTPLLSSVALQTAAEKYPVPVNPSGIRPVEFKVLIRPVKVEEKTAGGVIIPEMARDREQAAAVEGEIIAVSPLAFNYERWPDEAMKPKAGDRVYFAKYAGMTAKGRDGIEYRLLNDKDVCAVIA